MVVAQAQAHWTTEQEVPSSNLHWELVFFPLSIFQFLTYSIISQSFLFTLTFTILLSLSITIFLTLSFAFLFILLSFTLSTTTSIALSHKHSLSFSVCLHFAFTDLQLNVRLVSVFLIRRFCDRCTLAEWGVFTEGQNFAALPFVVERKKTFFRFHCHSSSPYTRYLTVKQ